MSASVNVSSLNMILLNKSPPTIGVNDYRHKLSVDIRVGHLIGTQGSEQFDHLQVSCECQQTLGEVS